MCLIKVINSTAFRLSLIPPIIITTLPLLVLLKVDSLHLSAPPPTLGGTLLVLRWLTLCTRSE